MTVIFYKYNGIKNKINKTLENGFTVNDVIIQNDFDITDFYVVSKNNALRSEYN